MSSTGQIQVYLGNGCFWARQFALVKVEVKLRVSSCFRTSSHLKLHALDLTCSCIVVQQSAAFKDRTDAEVTALAGYAGSTHVGPGTYTFLELFGVDRARLKGACTV